MVAKAPVLSITHSVVIQQKITPGLKLLLSLMHLWFSPQYHLLWTIPQLSPCRTPVITRTLTFLRTSYIIPDTVAAKLEVKAVVSSVWRVEAATLDPELDNFIPTWFWEEYKVGWGPPKTHQHQLSQSSKGNENLSLSRHRKSDL